MSSREVLFRSRALRVLVGWCGVWQAGHLLLTINTLFFGATAFPPPPPEGWSTQTWQIFHGMVASDMIQAALTLVFVVGFFAKRQWSFVLGIVCLGGSAFNSFAFTCFMVLTGAWAAHPGNYTMIQVLWAPLFILLLWLCRALGREAVPVNARPDLSNLLVDA